MTYHSRGPNHRGSTIPGAGYYDFPALPAPRIDSRSQEAFPSPLNRYGLLIFDGFLRASGDMGGRELDV